MRLLKTHVLLRLYNSYIVDSPQPANLSYLWNFGSLLGTCLIIQILTGAFLAMHYTPNVDLAFNSVEHENKSKCVLKTLLYAGILLVLKLKIKRSKIKDWAISRKQSRILRDFT